MYISKKNYGFPRYKFQKLNKLQTIFFFFPRIEDSIRTTENEQSSQRPTLILSKVSCVSLSEAELKATKPKSSMAHLLLRNGKSKRKF